MPWVWVSMRWRPALQLPNIFVTPQLATQQSQLRCFELSSVASQNPERWRWYGILIHIYYKLTYARRQRLKTAQAEGAPGEEAFKQPNDTKMNCPTRDQLEGIGSPRSTLYDHWLTLQTGDPHPDWNQNPPFLAPELTTRASLVRPMPSLPIFLYPAPPQARELPR